MKTPKKEKGPAALEGAGPGGSPREHNSSSRWRPVNRRDPCPACGHIDWCAWSPDGCLKCERATDAPSGMTRVSMKDGGALFRPSNGNGSHRAGSVRPAPKSETVSPINWQSESERFREAITAEQTKRLAADLGVTTAALGALGIGWASANDLRGMKASGAGWSQSYHDGAFTFPERDGNGRIVGLSLRAMDGRKGAPSGAKRGLCIPSTMKDRTDPVLIVEGASDVAACVVLGLAVCGRPSNAGGADALAQLLDSRSVLVVGENDQKNSGAWPGRDGAKRIAAQLAAAWEGPVSWTLPPSGTKDVRAWLQTRIAAGLDLNDSAACANAGSELLAALDTGKKECKAKKIGTSERLVRLAEELFRIGLAEGDEAFAVKRDGTNVAMMFRGSRDALRSALSREYRRRTGHTPSASALADALTALHGAAMECTAEPVYLRVAEHDGAIVIDLGDASGRAVIVQSGGWEVVDGSPVLFKRTALTGVLPQPERGGDLAELRGLMNVDDQSWPLVLGWAVAAMIPSIAHPIMLASGQQGTGKTTAMIMLVSFIDPSPAPVRSVPSDPEAWALAAAGSWAVVVDNVSNIPAWWSDALCKAVSGDGWIRRRLYTDGELSVVSFRRVLALTSIDAGALRGDLSDRLLVIDLEPIPDVQRRSETELRAIMDVARPRLFGAMLDLLAEVRQRLPDVKLQTMPRMADFARVLAAIDDALGTRAFDTYISQRGRIADDVIESDPVGVEIRSLAEQGPWSGTAGELLARIKPEKLGPDWPKNPRAMAGRVKRLIPALGTVGVQVIPPHKSDKTRRYVVQRTAQTAQPPDDGPGDTESSHDGAAVDDPQLPNSPADRPNETGTETTAEVSLGDSGDLGGRSGTLSSDGIPHGWTADSWRRRLLYLADASESVNPARALELRQQAAGIR